MIAGSNLVNEIASDIHIRQQGRVCDARRENADLHSAGGVAESSLRGDCNRVIAGCGARPADQAGRGIELQAWWQTGNREAGWIIRGCNLIRERISQLDRRWIVKTGDSWRQDYEGEISGGFGDRGASYQTDEEVPRYLRNA